MSIEILQILSEDMGLDEMGSETLSGPGSVSSSELGSVCEESYQRTTSSDSVYDTESTTSSRESLTEPPPSVSQARCCKSLFN